MAFDKPENHCSSWLYNQTFKPYWDHYNAVKSWYYNHKYAMWRAKVMTDSMMMSPYLPYYNPYLTYPFPPQAHCSQCSHSCCSRGSSCCSSSSQRTNHPRKKKKKHSSKQKNVPQNQNSDVPLYGFTDEDEPVSTKNEDEEEEFEMQITEEMIAFFEQSERHRRELKAQRDAENAENPDNYNQEYSVVENAFTGHLQLSCLPPREQPGVRRTAEMKLLYGKSAAMIHGMETAMQLTFDRNCDLLQPKLWPNIPLKL